MIALKLHVSLETWLISLSVLTITAEVLKLLQDLDTQVVPQQHPSLAICKTGIRWSFLFPFQYPSSPKVS